MSLSIVLIHEINAANSITSVLPQPAITCSKLTKETPEQGVKYVLQGSGVFIVNF